MKNFQIKETIILKVFLVISIIGILFLLFLSTLPQKILKISEINENFLNKKVHVQGQILNLKNYENFQLITLKDDTGEISIIIGKKTNLKNNQTIKVLGTLKKYKNSLQIQADRIE